MNETTREPAIGSPELQQYRRDGYLICHRQLLPADKLKGLIAIGEQYLEEVCCQRRTADLNVPHFSDPRLFEYMMDPGLLDTVQAITGPDIALWSSQFFCKDPGDPRPIPWHADAHYWQDYLDPIEVVGIWLALDEADAANGCLKLMPGSHRRRDWRYERSDASDNPLFPRRVCADQIDWPAVRSAELARGEFVLFDGHTLHGSDGNFSDRRRFGFTLRFMPTHCRCYPRGQRSWLRRAKLLVDPLRTALTGRRMYEQRIYLARGQDRAGNSYAPW